MSYRLVIGSAGSGKSTALRNEIIERAGKSLGLSGGEEVRYLYIVPEQYNMQTQLDLVKSSGCGGIMNIDVLSFGRLAYRVFSETGTSLPAVIDEIGKMLVLRKLAGDTRKDLKVLDKAVHRPGMASELKSVLSEFMQYGVGPEELESLIRYAQEKGQGALQARLEDLLVIYKSFASFKEGRFITAEETLDVLAGCIGEAASLRSSVVVFEGFTDYTPVQYRVIRELLRCTREVIFAVTGPAEDGEASWEAAAAGRIGSEQDLFYLSRKMVRDLAAIARGVGCTFDGFTFLEGGKRFRSAPVLAHLEQQVFRHPPRAYDGDPGNALQCLAAQSPEEETRAICARIRSMILEEGYTYRDIAVVTGDLETYGPLFEKMAVRGEIPLYLDRTVMILQNPLTDGIRSALSVVTENFSYESVLRYLRSGLSRVTSEEADLLDNYCLEHGIEGRRKWSLAFDEQNEPVRRTLLSELEPLTGLSGDGRVEEKQPRRIRTAGQRTEAVYAFLEGVNAGGRMEELADRFSEEGNSVQERICRQIYRSVLVLLEQVWELLGEEIISAKEYLELIEAGCSAVHLGTLPQKADRVLIGDIRRTRLPEVRVLFIAGVNDGIIPQAVSRGGILSDMDREFLKTSQMELAPDPRQRMFTQRFHLYQNMTRATDRLVFSYAGIGADGKSLHPSYLVNVLQQLYPDLRTAPAMPQDIQEQFSCIRDALPRMGELLRAFAQQRSDTDTLTLYRVLWEKGEREDRHSLRTLREAAFLHYRPVRITPETAAALYGRTLTGSVTMLEQAAQCMLRQFLRYGLRLKERPEYVFKPVDAGTVLHAGLEKFSGKLRSRGLSWRQLGQEDLTRLAAEALDESAAVYHDQILYASARSRYRLNNMQRILDRSVRTLQFHLQQGEFEPWEYELAFGNGKDGRELDYTLSGGRRLRLRGAVDRVDLCRRPEGTYVKIIDYKSGARSLDPAEIMAGRQLQLIMYMNAVLRLLQRESEGEVSPSAMLYYRLTDPVIPLKEGIDGEDQSAGLETERRKALRPTGMVRSDGRDTGLLDSSGRKDSLVIPAARKNDGGFTKNSKVYTLGEFRTMTEAVDRQVCLLAEAVLDGDAAAEPLKNSKDSACTWCPFRDICGFDLKTPGYHYRG